MKPTPPKKYIVSIRAIGSGDWSVIGTSDTFSGALDIAIEIERQVALRGVHCETRVYKETENDN